MNVLGEEFDPLTGVKTIYAVEENKFVVKSVQDVEPILERNNALRNAEEYSRNGIKNNLWHTVHIPDSVCLKMKVEDGFDPYAATARELRAFLRRNRLKYANLFVTGGRI